MIDETMALLVEAGFRKPVCQLKLSDKSLLREVLIDYHLMVKVKMNMDQFAEGLQVLKVLDAIRSQPALLKPLFVTDEATLSAGTDHCPCFLLPVYMFSTDAKLLSGLSAG